MNKLVIYDIESDRQFKITLPHEIKAGYKLQWMDGYRNAFVENDKSYMIDFDGSNEQQIVPSIQGGGIYFSPDYKTVFSVAPSTVAAGRYAFTITSLIKK